MATNEQNAAAAPAAPAQIGADQAALSPAYVRFALIILLVVYTLNFLDRQIVNILAHPIQTELGLSDTQLGLLTGLAFALFYTVLGIPLARYADNPKSHRPGLIAGALAVWSGMTALCGMAQNFTQLLLARIGVGVGEAGCTPPAHSLISDYVPREKRASAMSLYGIGVPLGGLLGMVLGGQLAELYGWRAAFLIVGLPGIVLAIAVAILLKDPRRQQAAATIRAAAAPTISTVEAVREVLSSKAFILLAAGASIIAFLGYGKGVWTTILFARTHGMPIGDVGLWLGISAGIAGMIGMSLGGWLGDKFGKKDARHYITAPAIAMALATPLLYFGYTAPDWRVAMALIFLPAIANNLYYGPTFALAQMLVRPRARALASAILLFVVNLVGLGLGPLAFGALSDALKPIAGGESVRWVLVCAAFLGLLPAVLFWLAGPVLRREIKAT
jgi:MFS family permease